MNNVVDYTGNECVIVGNGNTLHITSVGNTELVNGESLLKLNNMLFVPEITKNLVSVSKLAQDSNIFFDFNDSYCLVKDKGTGRVLMKRVLNDELYQLEDIVVVPNNFATQKKNDVVNKNNYSTVYALSKVNINSVVSRVTRH